MSVFTVLAPDGVDIVATRNKDWYKEEPWLLRFAGITTFVF